MALKNLLHVAPNAIGNAYNIYNPDIQSALGAFALANFSNPLQVVCVAIGAVENSTASETSKLCSQYLGPALRLLNFNYLPVPFNAYLGKSPSPWNLIYPNRSWHRVVAVRRRRTKCRRPCRPTPGSTETYQARQAGVSRAVNSTAPTHPTDCPPTRSPHCSPGAPIPPGWSTAPQRSGPVLPDRQRSRACCFRQKGRRDVQGARDSAGYSAGEDSGPCCPRGFQCDRLRLRG